METFRIISRFTGLTKIQYKLESWYSKQCRNRMFQRELDNNYLKSCFKPAPNWFFNLGSFVEFQLRKIR